MKFSLNRSWLILGVALGLGGLAAYGVNRYITRQVEDIEARDKARKTVRVLVPKDDLPKGAPLTATVVATRDIPAEWAHSNALTPDQFDRVENQKLAYPAARGEMLLWSLLEGQRAPSFSSRLPTGHRAITVPVDEVNSISGMLEPGDRIDLMATVRKESRFFMFPLLQNVAVLATGSRVVVEADGKEGKRTFTTITLDASPEEAQRVLAAREVGKLAALLRAPGDTATKTGARKDAMALLGILDERAIEPGGVPVLYGGQGAAAKGGQMPGLAPARAAPSLGDTLVR
jgi:pilus assembly protein CpaB